MGDLLLQLRELSKDRWESFVQQYLRSKYPGMDIKRSEGAGGDAGIDSFYGQLDEKPLVWQCKHFPGRIKQPQQRQVLKSIKASFKTHPPSVWTLCVPIDLRTVEHSWFQRNVIDVYGGTEKIKLLQASDFLGELLQNRILRDEFFPEEALSRMQDVRKALTSTDGLTKDGLALIATEYAQQYLESTMKLEPRLDAILAVGGNSARRSGSQPFGTIFSATRGDMTMHLVPKDIQSLALDPITLSFGIATEQRLAFDSALDSGRRITLPAGSIKRLASSSPLISALLSEGSIEHMELTIEPAIDLLVANQQIPVRLVADPDGRRRGIQYVPFHVSRKGRKEVELTSKSQLPFLMTIVVTPNAISLNFSPRIQPGSDLIAVNRVIDFLTSLESSGIVEVINAETDERYLRSNGAARSNINIAGWVRQAIADAAEISRKWNIPFSFPKELVQSDLETLRTLKPIATGEEFSNIRTNLTLTKSPATPSLSDFAGLRVFPFRVDYPSGLSGLRLFDEDVPTPAIRFEVDKAYVVDAQACLERYNEINDGDQMQVELQCDGPCRWVLLPKEEPVASTSILAAGSNEMTRKERRAPHKAPKPPSSSEPPSPPQPSTHPHPSYSQPS